jgi:DNA sulfur modification protein DndD
MKLLSLTMHNFMPYKGTQTLTFPGDPARNVMIVLGDNMRGKSSILNAMRWAFYDSALDRHLNNIPLHELLNNEAADEGDGLIEVHVRFEANGHLYDLRRRAQKKPFVARPSRPEDFEATVSLQRDSMAVPGFQIEPEINQIAPEQISRFFLFDGELLQEYESLLIEGSAQGKKIKEAIEQVLGVPALVQGRDEISTLLKTAQRQQTRDLSQVKGLEAQAEEQGRLQEKQQALESDLADIKSRLAKTHNERLQLDDELGKLADKLRAKAEIDVLETQLKLIHDQQGEREKERLSLVRDVWRDLLDAKLTLRRDQLLAEQQKYTAEIARRGALEANIERLKEMISATLCPSCGGTVPQERRDAAGADLGRLEGELRSLTTNQEALARCHTELTALARLKATGAGSRIRNIDAETKRAGVELTRIENKVEKLKDEIYGFDTAETARKRALRDQLFKEETRLESDSDAVREGIEDTKRKLSLIALALKGLSAARASRATAIVNTCDSLEKVFNQSIQNLRENLRTKVQVQATQAFLQLTHQKAYKSLQINDAYGLTIIDDTDRAVSVRSAGAEQIVALSLIDGLNRTGRAAGPIMMDTPFGRLDLKHRANILRYLPTVASQFILLVHDGEFRRDTDLVPLAERIGAAYEIREVNSRYSRIERASL